MPRSSPTVALLLGLVITLATVLAYSAYISRQIAGLRTLQTDLADRNRRDSLQLLRIQSDLNQLALAMRDMLDNLDGYPLTAWSGQMDRMRDNLDDAIRVESKLAANRRDPQQTAYLLSSFAQFWSTVEHMQKLAQTGQDKQARDLVRHSLLPRQEALSALTARLLVMNAEADQRADSEILATYAGIERNAWLFLALSLVIFLFFFIHESLGLCFCCLLLGLILRQFPLSRGLFLLV